MRSIWNGSLVVGRVAIPVGLCVAQARNEISFRTLHRECGLPITQTRACPEHGGVDADELVRGFEIAPGQFVLVEDADLELVAPESSRVIMVDRFVALEDVDPLCVDRAYWLEPAGELVAARPYALLLRVLEPSYVGAIARFRHWGKEHLALVRAHRGALLLQTLFYAEDLRPADEIVGQVATVRLADGEVELASALVAKLSGPFVHDDYANEHRAALRTLLEAKLAGAGDVVPPLELADAPAPTTDLEAALRQSIRSARKPARRRGRPRAEAAHAG